MQKVTLQLYKAGAADESYAIRFPAEEKWLARLGFGSELDLVWSVDLESDERFDRNKVDWAMVLERVIEAYRLSDPVLTNFRWPEQVMRHSDPLVE